MFFIIGADGKEYGPTDAAGIKSWIEMRRANLQTRARRADETEWKTLGDFSEFADVVAPPPAIPATPPAIAAPDTGPVTPAAVDVNAYAQEIIARGVKISIGGSIGRAWEFCKKDYWAIVAATFLGIFLPALPGMIGAFIPFAGPLIQLVAQTVLTGICLGGLYYYLLKKMRGIPCEIGDVFAGFSRLPGQLILTGVFQTLITLVPLLPVLALIFGGIALKENTPETPETGIALIIAGAALGAILWAALVYLMTAWYFAYALVIDKRLKAWDAMEVSRRVVTAQWWRMFGLIFVGSIVGGIGILACYVGLLFTLPIFVTTIAFAYEDLFGASAPALPDNATPANDETGSPEA